MNFRAVLALTVLAATAAIPAPPATASPASATSPPSATSAASAISAASAAVTRLMPGDILISAGGVSGPLHLLDPDTGTHSLYASDGPMGGPDGLAIAPDGDLVTVVGASTSGSVWRVDRATEQQFRVANGDLLRRPTGVVVEADGTILVSTINGLVVVNPTTGAQTMLAAGAMHGIAIGPGNDLLVTLANAVARIDRGTGAATIISAGGALTDPAGLDVEPNGEIVVVNTSTDSLVLIDPATGSQRILPVGAENHHPKDVAVDADGQLVVSSYPAEVTGTLIRIDPRTGVITMLSNYDWHLDLVSAVTIVPDHRPVAGDDVYRTDEDEALQVPAGGLLGNDTDADGETLTAELVTPAAHGTVTVRPDGSFSYRPAPEYSGADSFTYAARGGHLPSAPATVRLTVTPVNDAPVAAAESYRANVTGSLLPLVIAAPGVLGNDHDVDSATLTAVLTTAPRHGRLTLRADGSFTYRPDLLFLGTDSFRYQAADASGSRSPAVQVTLTVSLL